MNETAVIRLLGRLGAVITNDHIVYTSGKHGSAYVNKDAVYPHTRATSRLCKAIAEHFRHDDIEVVIAPAIGGVILSNGVAAHLTRLTKREVLGVHAEKPGSENTFAILRGYDRLIKGARVLVVEDILTTGGSAKAVIDVTKTTGGNVIGLGVLCNRGGVTAEDMGVPSLFALANIPLEAWDEADCPLCKAGMPINTVVGKGRQYLQQRA